MPHLVLVGGFQPQEAARSIGADVHRWGRSVLKTDVCWKRGDEEALLVEGVVVEFSRPLHPVALIAAHHDDTIVRLWPLCAVERTLPVQRWLAVLAVELQQCGAGPVRSTNISDETLDGLDLKFCSEST